MFSQKKHIKTQPKLCICMSVPPSYVLGGQHIQCVSFKDNQLQRQPHFWGIQTCPPKTNSKKTLSKKNAVIIGDRALGSEDLRCHWVPVSSCHPPLSSSPSQPDWILCRNPNAAGSPNCMAPQTSFPQPGWFHSFFVSDLINPFVSI